MQRFQTGSQRLPMALALIASLALVLPPALRAADAPDAADAPNAPTAPTQPAAAAVSAAAWDTLPDTSWLVISLPDLKHTRQAFESGKLRALGKLDGFKDFVGDVRKFYMTQMNNTLQNGTVQPFLKVLHLDLDSLLSAPSGELTFAMVEAVPAEQRFDLVFRADVEKPEQIASFNDLIDMVLAMRPDLPLKKTEQKFGDKKAYALEIPEMNLAAYYSTNDNCLNLATRDERFAAQVQRKSLTLEKETALKDSALVKAVVKTLQGQPDFFFLVNPEAIPEKQVDDPGQLRLFQGLKRLGVRKFAYALRFDDATGNVFESLIFDYDPDVWKAGAPITQPVDLSVFEHGAGGTFAQAGINVNWAQAWSVINNFIKTGPNAEEGTRTIDSLEKFLGMKVPEFLAAFDGHITGNMSLPRTQTGFAANLLPDGFVEFGLKDPQRVEDSMARINTWAAGAAEGHPAFTAEKIPVEGARAAWIYTPPGRRDPLKPVLAIYDGKMILAAMKPTLRRAVRATPYGPQLEQREDWQKLKTSIDKNAFAVAYLDLSTATEFGYNLAASMTAMMQNNPFAKYNLPEGDQIGRVMSGWLLQAYTEGHVLVIQSQSPTGVASSLACTALIANYMGINEAAERNLVRREMTEKRLVALYQAVVKFNTDLKKLPGKLSELYPDYLTNIADFTAADQNWSMNPNGNGDRLRALIEDRTEFVMLPGNFGKADKAFLAPRQFVLTAGQGYPVIDGAGTSRIYSEDEFARLVKDNPEIGGPQGPQGQRPGDHRGGWHRPGPGDHPGPGNGGKQPAEPPPLPPPQDNPEQGF